MTAERLTDDVLPAPGVTQVPGAGARPRVRLGGPGALVACLPRLIGFPPVESLVVVGLVRLPTGRDEITMTVRLDLDDVWAAIEHRGDQQDALWEQLRAAPDDEVVLDQMQRLSDERGANPCHPVALADVLLRNDCDRAVVVAISDQTSPPDRSRDLAELSAERVAQVVAETALCLQASGIRLTDALLVREGRWWSYRCSDPICCPPEGTPVRLEDADLLESEMAWAGDSTPVLAGRADLAARVAARDDVESAALREALRRLGTPSPVCPDREKALAAAAALIERFRSSEPRVTTQEWARLLTDLHDVVVRDACLGAWKGTAGEQALSMWCAAARISPPGHVAPPATIAAVLAHARGKGALAGEAVARALDDDPDYRLGRYASQLLVAGAPPTTVRRTIVAALAELRARGEPVLDSRGRLLAGGSRPSRRRRR